MNENIRPPLRDYFASRLERALRLRTKYVLQPEKEKLAYLAAYSAYMDLVNLNAKSFADMILRSHLFVDQAPGR
jgi:hypothetical protein